MNKIMLNGLIILISLVAGTVIFDRIAMNLQDFHAGDIGLGIATSSHQNEFEGLPINQTHGDMDQIVSTIKMLKDQKREIVLLLGNSQLHSINYYKNGDHLAVYYLNEMAVSFGSNLRFVQLSSPNINFQEMLIYYLTLRQKNCLPDWITIGATYRSFQLSSVRESFLSHLNEIDLANQSLDNESFLSFVTLLPPKQETNKTEDRSMQEKLESSLEQLMEDNWEAYRYRGNVRSRIKIIPGIFYQKYFARTTFYDGSDAAEKANTSYFIQTMDLAARDSVKVLVYQPPHPDSDDPFQYDRSKYDLCFERIQTVCTQLQGAYYRSFEDAVPLEFWGLNNRGRLDVFHFKDAGHQMLAEKIFHSFQELKNPSGAVQ